MFCQFGILGFAAEALAELAFRGAEIRPCCFMDWRRKRLVNQTAYILMRLARMPLGAGLVDKRLHG